MEEMNSEPVQFLLSTNGNSLNTNELGIFNSKDVSSKNIKKEASFKRNR